MESSADKFVPLSLIAIEHIDIDRSRNAIDTPVSSQLPVDELDIGLVFAIAGYPHIIALFDVCSMRHVLVDEHLTDIEDWTHVGATLDIVHENADATHEFLVAANLAYLRICGFYIEHWRKITRSEQGMVDEIGCLSQCGTLQREEVVGTDTESLPTRLHIVRSKIAVADAGTLRRLDIDKGDRKCLSSGMMALSE